MTGKHPSENDTLFSLLNRLIGHVSSVRQRQFCFLAVLMVLSSFAEILSIGAVFPFLGVLTTPKYVFEHSLAIPLLSYFNITSADELLLPVTIGFIFAVLSASAIRLFLLWATTKLSFATGADLSVDIYRKTLYQPYSVHLSRNSSEIIDGISVKTNNVIYSVILPSLTLISSAILVITILIALYVMNPMIAMVSFGGFGSIYALIIILTKKRILHNGRKIAFESSRLIKSLQEGLGGIRDILLDNTQSIYCKSYQATDRALRQAQGSNLFISQSPRFGMEALGMVLIAILAYGLSSKSDGVSTAIPLLGAFALGAQRLLPILQQAYYGWTNIRGMQSTLASVLELLDQPVPSDSLEDNPGSIAFEKHISLNNVSFRYPASEIKILDKLNLMIPKGSRVGIIGATGSGKSTLLDMLMLLLEPASGTIEIDGVELNASNRLAWQKHIAHVPQTIFLTDSSIAENIAFGVERANIDFDRVKRAAIQAQISETIECLPKKYDTYVGERGVRLSGGQRQRIGIARALYKEADVIILDEATSALDNETEEALISSINALSKDITVLMIAHRLTTLKDCDMIVELGASGVVKIGNYQSLIS